MPTGVHEPTKDRPPLCKALPTGVLVGPRHGGDLQHIPDAHLEFLRQCVPYHETDEFIFVHANYAAHSPLEAQPERLLFWEHLSTTTPPPHISGKTVFVGHTPQSSGDVWDLGHLVCLDTYCFGGGWLTAMEAHTRETWQADVLGQLRVNQ